MTAPGSSWACEEFSAHRRCFVAIHLPFEPVSAAAMWKGMGTRGPSIFPFGPGMQERVAGVMLFGAVAGIATAWVERVAIAWAGGAFILSLSNDLE